MAKQQRLPVWMYGRHVATLTRARDRLSLAYTEEALDTYDVNTPLLSISLPVGPQMFPHDRVRPFFEGLLPEGETRRMLAHDFRLQEDDVLGLLGILGRDCAGALVILPEGEALPAPDTSTPTILTREEVVARLCHLSIEPLGVDEQVRVSLAGIQQKMVLSRLQTGDWALPINGLPSTHILKRGDPRFPEMVANEAFCLAMGRHLGLPVASAEALDVPDPILVVRRYDRDLNADGQIRRIHQEDLAQALGVGSRAKYEERGGPSLRTIARLLRDWTLGSEDREHLLDLTLLNMVLGNGDAHAKNFSLLHDESGAVRLAPAYDLLSTAFYPQADVRPGMYVNGKRSIHDITTSDVVAEATTWGLNEGRVTTRVAHLLERLPVAVAEASLEVPAAPRELIELVNARVAAFTADRPTRQ